MAASRLVMVEADSQVILDRGRAIGFWLYDPETATIAWASFDPATPALKAKIEETQSMIQTELGDVRSFSLDSPKSRAPKIASLRAGKFV